VFRENARVKSILQEQECRKRACRPDNQAFFLQKALLQVQELQLKEEIQSTFFGTFKCKN